MPKVVLDINSTCIELDFVLVDLVQYLEPGFKIFRSVVLRHKWKSISAEALGTVAHLKA